MTHGETPFENCNRKATSHSCLQSHQELFILRSPANMKSNPAGAAAREHAAVEYIAVAVLF
jgi:hypothetical protein